MKVSVIIPAFNEGATILKTLEAVARALPQAEIVVIDDGSKDKTGRLAEKRAKVVRHIRNRGKAAALTTGLRASRGDIIAMVDGDMGDLAGEVSHLVEDVLAGNSDLAVAKFNSSQGGGVGLVRGIARWGIFLFTRRRLESPLSGQRAGVRRVFEECLPSKGGFGLETELTLRALRRGYRVGEVPTNFVHQGHGWSVAGFRHRGRQFYHVLLALIRGGFSWR